MIQLPIQQIPNQEFSINLEGSFYDIAIHETNGVMAVSIVRDTVAVVTNARAVAGFAIIPARYQEQGKGNFTFLTLNQQLPNWLRFNVSQDLVYFTGAELDALRLPAVPPIPTLAFNPIAALPQRYSPQGY